MVHCTKQVFQFCRNDIAHESVPKNHPSLQSHYMSPQAKAVYLFFLPGTCKIRTDKNPSTITSTMHTHVHACMHPIIWSKRHILHTYISISHTWCVHGRRDKERKWVMIARRMGDLKSFPLPVKRQLRAHIIFYHLCSTTSSCVHPC